MNWLLFYLLAALHPVAFLVIAWKCETWRQRLLLWALLPLPAVLYCWDYWVVKNEHAQMCAAEGGLKVLIQPEKADRVRLVGVELRDASTGMLVKYYPRIQAVEALAGKYDGTDGSGQPYVVYTVVRNPQAGLPMAKDPWKEPELIYPYEVIGSPSRSLYEISVHTTESFGRTIKETRLSKEGKLYAKYTELVHWWTGIQYPDALPTWRCPEQKLSPPKGDLNAGLERWQYPPMPYYALVELILK